MTALNILLDESILLRPAACSSASHHHHSASRSFRDATAPRATRGAARCLHQFTFHGRRDLTFSRRLAAHFRRLDAQSTPSRDMPVAASNEAPAIRVVPGET